MSTTATSRILHAPEGASGAGKPRSWVWPLPRLDGLSPCILAAVRMPPTDDVEIGYSSRIASASNVPVMAAQDGIIAYAESANGSCTLCIDHAGGWSTQYSDLERLLVRPTDRFRRRRKERVQAGDVVGHASRSSLRVHFALSRLTDGEPVAMDPSIWMLGWSMLPWFDVALPSHRHSQASAGDLHAVLGKSPPGR